MGSSRDSPLLLLIGKHTREVFGVAADESPIRARHAEPTTG